VSIGIILILRGDEPEPAAEDLEVAGDEIPEQINLPPIEEDDETIGGTRYSD
jgi:hypothetical protein